MNLPTFHVIAKQLNVIVPKNIENKRAKTFTVANQTEIPIIHYVSMTCFTEVNQQNQSFNIEFAVANVIYKVLGAPFFKRNIQNIDFQQNILTHKEQHPKLPTKPQFSTFTEKNHITSNHDQERLYTSQSKIILTFILNWKRILNFIHQIHIHTSYKNLKKFLTSWT